MFNSYYEKVAQKTVKIDKDIPFDIPSNWQWVRLSEITNTISAGGDRPDVFSKIKTEQCQIPIFSNGIESDGLYGYTNTAKIYDRSITVSARGTIGFSCIRNEPYVPIVRLISVVPNVNISLDYLYIFFSGAMESGDGTSTPQLTVPNIKQKFIALPPREEQDRIVRIVNTATGIIKKIAVFQNDLLELCSQLKSAILAVFFGENSRYKSYYGKRTETTLEKLIPNEKIGDGDWVLSEDMNPNGDIQLLQLKHIGNMVYQNKSFCHIDENFFKEHNCSEIKENYLLINRLVASSMACCLMPQTNTKTITSVDVCWIAPDETYNSKYIMYYLSSKNFQNKVLMLCSGSTRKRISKKNLTRIPLFIHDRMQQDIIVNKIENLFELVEKVIG